MNEKRLKEWMNSRRSRKNPDTEALFDAIRAGDRTALSAGITLVESKLPSDRELARELLNSCLPFAGKSVRIGITGVPGVGKSSFIEAFGKILLEKRGKMAVLAIDPSSERTGGSILGDKTRMQELSTMENVFIRPSSAGSTLGGVARMTRETIILCEAAGFETILIETVGVGQSEIMVHSMVDFFLLLLLTGAGDELQGIKRGIMEMADGLAVTKADGENERKADLAAREVKNAIHLFPPTASGWIPEVHVSSSATGKNLEEIFQMIEKYERHTKLNGFFAEKRREQELRWLHETVTSLLLENFRASDVVKSRLPKLEKMVGLHEITAFEAADKLIATFRKKEK